MFGNFAIWLDKICGTFDLNARDGQRDALDGTTAGTVDLTTFAHPLGELVRLGSVLRQCVTVHNRADRLATPVVRTANLTAKRALLGIHRRTLADDTPRVRWPDGYLHTPTDGNRMTTDQKVRGSSPFERAN